MYMQFANSVLRTCSRRAGVGQALKVPLTCSSLNALRLRSLGTRPVSSTKRIVSARDQTSAPRKPAAAPRKSAADDSLQQAIHLGVALPEVCNGCGVSLQANNPDAPG